MRIARAFRFSIPLLFGFLSRINAQNPTTPESPRPLVLTEEAISTPGIQGRFDHFGFDGKNQLFVAALGNNSVEVIDISMFQQTDPDHYQLLAKVSSTLGPRSAGYFGKGRKGFDRFFLGVPARADHGAEIWIYTVQD
jgi:hypothetical protein